jgi:dihydrodipicolinate synthase/N-acetylneuraminate lyase
MGGDRKMHPGTVIGIPSFYNKDESLDLISLKKYIKYLEENDASCIMTTAGTSQFNLLSKEEILKLNEVVCRSFKRKKIIGIPPLSLKDTGDFIQKSNRYIDKETFFMALFPERFYSEKDIIKFMTSVRSFTNKKIYIHCKTIRNVLGGNWDYTSSVINALYENNILEGIKEEHPSLNKSYNFVSKLNNSLDIIVAGGSMRRYQFLKSAGATTFLSGIGNFFPHIEQEFLDGNEKCLQIENKFFDVFMKYGWHRSLRMGLGILGFGNGIARQPWPSEDDKIKNEIKNIINEIQNEK